MLKLAELTVLKGDYEAAFKLYQTIVEMEQGAAQKQAARLLRKHFHNKKDREDSPICGEFLAVIVLFEPLFALPVLFL